MSRGHRISIAIARDMEAHVKPKSLTSQLISSTKMPMAIALPKAPVAWAKRKAEKLSREEHRTLGTDHSTLILSYPFLY